jgi:hypothetical protein
MLAAPGTGEGLAEFAATHYPVLKYTDFTTMIGPALTIAGDKDINPMFSDRLSYRWDTYSDSPGRATLLTVFGGGHMLGGISGYDAAETTDENPQRVALVRALTWAYLRSSLYPGDSSWDEAVAAPQGSSGAAWQSRVEVGRGRTTASAQADYLRTVAPA